MENKEIKDYLHLEEWKPISGVPFYEASNYGRIRSIDKQVRHNYGGAAIKRGRIISQYIDSNGYFSCGVIINGITRTQKAHRLVALAWIPNPENKPTVNHKFGNKLDNIPSQLEWATHAEQMRHAFDIGLCGNSPRTIAQDTYGVEAAKKPVIATDFRTGESYFYNSVTECASGLCVTQSCISQSLLRGNRVQRKYKIKYAA